MNSRQLERLYDDHASRVFAFLANLTRSEADAADLVQEVFAKVARRPLFLVREPRRYLLRAAHNAFVDLVRRESRRRGAVEEFRLAGDSFWICADESEDAERLMEELARLPEEQRAVVHLKIWEELTFRKIAGTLGIPANTAASRYRYAIDKLRGAARLHSENESI